MLPDLEHLIALQRLEDAVEHARRTITDHPERVKALEARLDESRGYLAAARQRESENVAARRALEKDLAMQQGRLGKFKDQLMQVKTNREYTAMQKEIEVAQHETRAIEDRILERMLEADDLANDIKRAEQALAAEQKAVAGERRALDEEASRLQVEMERATVEREQVLAQISAAALATYRFVATRRSKPVAEARDGMCSVCHVRLRPQVFNDVRRNEGIIQCDSCQRIMYFVPPPTPAPDV
jgi:predicted  nucleic acid-binding Zn-ribbon protein